MKLLHNINCCQKISQSFRFTLKTLFYRAKHSNSPQLPPDNFWWNNLCCSVPSPFFTVADSFTSSDFSHISWRYSHFCSLQCIAYDQAHTKFIANVREEYYSHGTGKVKRKFSISGQRPQSCDIFRLITLQAWLHLLKSLSLPKLASCS